MLYIYIYIYIYIYMFYNGEHRPGSAHKKALHSLSISESEPCVARGIYGKFNRSRLEAESSMTSKVLDIRH
jgi:hypothetical protein